MVKKQKSHLSRFGLSGSVALFGGDKRTRTYSAMKRQIYSLLRLSNFGVSPICLAERVGFEPTNRLLGLHLSRVLHYRSAIFPYVLKPTRADNPFRVYRLCGSVVNNLFYLCLIGRGCISLCLSALASCTFCKRTLSYLAPQRLRHKQGFAACVYPLSALFRCALNNADNI